MKENTCILCGREYPTGLHIMGCLICFPCEKRLLENRVFSFRRRRLAKLYPVQEMEPGSAVTR